MYITNIKSDSIVTLQIWETHLRKCLHSTSSNFFTAITVAVTNQRVKQSLNRKTRRSRTARTPPRTLCHLPVLMSKTRYVHTAASKIAHLHPKNQKSNSPVACKFDLSNPCQQCNKRTTLKQSCITTHFWGQHCWVVKSMIN
jgi:hypothetical protein